MKQLNLLFFLSLSIIAKCQNVELIAKSNYAPVNEKQKAFCFIDNKIDTTNFIYIATYKAFIGKSKKDNISNSFFLIRKMANKIGANSFCLKSFESDSSGILNFVLDTYQTNDATLELNFANQPKNKVYIFCDEKPTNETYSIKINNEKTEFKSGTFLSYELKEGQELKLNKGGLTGTTVWVKYQKDKPASFFTITGLGLGGAIPPPGTVGLSFNTGRFNSIDAGLGLLLIKFLKNAN